MLKAEGRKYRARNETSDGKHDQGMFNVFKLYDNVNILHDFSGIERRKSK